MTSAGPHTHSDHEHLPAGPLAEDEYVVDTPRVRRFIADVRATMAASESPEAAVAALRPVMAELLAEDGWLPAEFEREADPSKGMGGGIGTWLIYRSKEADLSLFTLVVPGWRATPVHDHLAWGLIGLYRGEQAETFYQRTDHGEQDGAARLAISERRMLKRGDLYELIPPDGDIHSVITIGEEPSVSLHLLANDVGCIWRHAFDPPTSSVKAFRSGYTNRPCPEEAGS
jgi:predicted metal-dependent enzyme (double-stranded beta helix superfamily)